MALLFDDPAASVVPLLRRKIRFIHPKSRLMITGVVAVEYDLSVRVDWEDAAGAYSTIIARAAIDDRGEESLCGYVRLEARMSKEWCPNCNVIRDFLDEGAVPYGEEHVAAMRICTECGCKVYGKMKRVRGISQSDQHNVTLLLTDPQQNPVPPEAEKEISILVQGSAPIPYVVRFWRIGNNVSSACTCPGSRFTGMCKHRQNLVYGDVTGVPKKGLRRSMNLLHKLLEGSDVAEECAKLQARPSIGGLNAVKRALKD